MAFLHYPEREPMGPLGQACHERCIELSRPYATSGEEHFYGADVFQSLIIHPASHPTGAALLFFHGGGWTHGFKEWMSMMAGPLNHRGITLISSGYRLAPEHLFPAGLEDCQSALRWVLTHHSRYAIDTGKIFVGGHSAGGHYASLLTLANASASSDQSVAGCLPISGVYLFGEGSGLTVRPRFLGPENHHVDHAASPLLADLSKAPPFLISYGERDFPHLKVQALNMIQALQNAGRRVQALELPDCDHLQASYSAAELDGMWIRHASQFMQADHV